MAHKCFACARQLILKLMKTGYPSRRLLWLLVAFALVRNASGQREKVRTEGATESGYQNGGMSAQKPRVVVTTDPELDDSNSLVRYLLYSTDFKTEVFVYASSQFSWKRDGTDKKWFVPGREYTRFGLNHGPHHFLFAF